MVEKSNSTVYIGNLDEKVSDRVLYDILIQAGRVVDLYIPRDKETDKPKGYAFAEYESEEVAEYAVKLFSGLVTLYKRTLRFAISGQDKPAASTTPILGSSVKSRPYNAQYNETEASSQSLSLSASSRFLDDKVNPQVPPDSSMHHHPSRYRSYHDNSNHNYSRRAYGAALESISRPRSGRNEMRD